MDVLILHRVPYARIDYARGIDHDRHDVTYFGKREILDTLPRDLRCTSVERPGVRSAYEEAIDWLRISPRSFDRVISLSEYELLDAARLRETLDIPGARLHQVRLVRDKIAMKRAVADTGLRVPRFMPLCELLTAQGVASWDCASVLKPHSGASSADVVVFDSPRHVFEAVSQQASRVAKLDAENAAIDEYEVEEFVAGPILHFDGLIEGGRIAVMTASCYVGTCLGYAQGRPLGSYHIPLQAEAADWAQRVVDAVQIDSGSFHLEAIEASQGLVFLEIGNRVGGADVVATFELATGVHMPSQELRMLLDDPLILPQARQMHARGWHGWFVYPGHHLGNGAHHGFDGVEEYRSSPSVVTWNELQIGTAFRSNVTYSAHEAPLAGIVATGGHAATRAWIEGLFASASLRVADADTAQLKHVA